MKEIIITVGISGSGKSTWVTNFLKNNNMYLRVNRDDIRKVIVADITNGYYKRWDLNVLESAVTDMETYIANKITNTGKNLVVDNTNLNMKYIKRWLDWAAIHSEMYKVKFKLFPISLEEAKQRVAKRDFGWDGTEWTGYFEAATQYIDKQYDAYKNVEKTIFEHHREKIIL